MEYSYELIDIDSHILFGVDHGAELPEDSEEILKECYNQGVKEIIVTPYRKKGVFELDMKHIKRNFRNLKQIAKGISKDIKLYLGSKIYYSDDIIKKIESGVYPKLNGSSYALVEFKKDVIFSNMYLALDQMINDGHIPIIVNSEKYEAFSELKKVEDIVEIGAYIHINANNILNKALIGEKHIKEKDLAQRLLRKKLVHIVGSGVKNTNYNMREAFNIVTKKYSEEYAIEIFRTNPQKVINDDII